MFWSDYTPAYQFSPGNKLLRIFHLFYHTLYDDLIKLSPAYQFSPDKKFLEILFHLFPALGEVEIM